MIGQPPPESFEEFRLLRKLGEGAMGEVWLAEDTRLKRQVAIKFVKARSQGARERFFEEARALARLSHPNVVAVHRVSEIHGRPFLVSEYVRGQSLERLDKPVPFAKALSIGIDLARGLSAAHRKGVLHRDIKPANAVIAEDGGSVKLVDFGLADLLPENDEEPPASAAAARGLREPDAPAAADADTTQSLSGEPSKDPTENSAPGESPAATESFSPGKRPRKGTLRYMAPEVARNEGGTKQSDVYSLGVLLLELCTGRKLHSDVPLADLAKAIRSGPAPSLAELSPDIDPRFAAAIGRCLAHDSALRFPSGDALREALERIDAIKEASDPIPEGNPYRPLIPFEAADRGLFFGRDADVRAVIERLRSQSFVLVTGDSGVGKSSLCRAGVLPALIERRSPQPIKVLGPLVLGRRPLEALAVSLAPLFAEHGQAPLVERALVERLRTEPSLLVRELHIRGTAGALLFIDQLEELCTLAPPDEAEAVAAALRALMERVPVGGYRTAWTGAVRVLCTARSDFLGRLAALPGLGDDLSSALYLLRPLSGEGMREAIVGPAKVKGYSFDPEALVESLMTEAITAPGGLPLLEFALAELWDGRQEATRTLTDSAFRAMGGVAGALAKHADSVLARLPVIQRDAARAILLELVTPEGTRVRFSENELLRNMAAREVARAALAGLVRGRLLVAREAETDGESAYEIAHEALLTGWDTLRGWLGQDEEVRAARQRLTRSAAEWNRLGRSKDVLWSEKQLREVESLDASSLGPVEADFLTASRRAAQRRRLLRWGGAATVLLAIALTAVLLRILAAQAQEDLRRDQDFRATLRMEDAVTRLADARAAIAEAAELRSKARVRYDTGDKVNGDKIWTSANERSAKANDAQIHAALALELALMLAPTRADLREGFADALYQRALFCENERLFKQRDELITRLLLYDDMGNWQRKWNAPGHILVSTSPPGAKVWLSRYEARAGKRVATTRELWGTTPIEERDVAQGSIVLTFELNGRAAVRLPLRIGRDSHTRVDVALPAEEAVPPAFIYIPAGTFLAGSTVSEEFRLQNEWQPLHPEATGAYLIAKREVTFKDWIAYLNALSPNERARRMPKLKDEFNAVELRETGGGHYHIFLKPSTATYSASEGQTIRYPDRTKRVEQDWLLMPVTGVSHDDATAYADWVATTGRVPGARLCEFWEWERAARGADDRMFPHGDVLDPDDANHDATYDRMPLAFGPDEVGSHPESTSPFGVMDMAGNVWEWTTRGKPIARGGSFYQAAMDGWVFNFHTVEPTMRSALIGLRLCATPQQ